MNIGDLSDEEMLKVFVAYCSKLMLSARQYGYTVATMEIDPKKVFGLPVDPQRPEAGLLSIAVASGASISKLKLAISAVMVEQ